MSWLRGLVGDCIERGREFNPGPVYIGRRSSTGTGSSVSLSVLTRQYHPASAQYSSSCYNSLSERQVGETSESTNIVILCRISGQHRQGEDFQVFCNWIERPVFLVQLQSCYRTDRRDSVNTIRNYFMLTSTKASCYMYQTILLPSEAHFVHRLKYNFILRYKTEA